MSPAEPSGSADLVRPVTVSRAVDMPVARRPQAPRGKPVLAWLWESVVQRSAIEPATEQSGPEPEPLLEPEPLPEPVEAEHPEPEHETVSAAGQAPLIPAPQVQRAVSRPETPVAV